MKYYVLVAFFTLTTAITFAQTNTFPNSGNVGIGTTTPRSVLDVAEFIPNGTLGTVFGRLQEGNGTGSGTFLGVRGYDTGTIDGKSFAIEHDFHGQTNSSINFHRGGSTTGGFISFATGTNHERLRITAGGNLIWNGYAAGNPRALTLGYSGGNYGGIGYNIDYTTTTGIFNRPLNDQSSYLEFKYGGFNFYGNANPTSSNGVNLNGGGNNLNLFAVITRTGDFGIGTETPREKLSVNGKIRAHEVKVETANWPDYVFEDGYKIGTLQELENYIKAKKHLPEVPSAKEVEANGVELGEMNKILLKKIEELTLHLIEKDKEVQSLKDEVNNIYKILSIPKKDTAKTTN